MVFLVNCKEEEQIYALIKPYTKSISDLMLFNLKKQPITDIFQLSLFNEQDLIIFNASDEDIIQTTNNHHFDTNVFWVCSGLSNKIENFAAKNKISILQPVNITDFNRSKIISSLWDQRKIKQDSMLMNLFISRMPNDYSIICQELDKLSYYLENNYNYNELSKLIYDYNNEQFFVLIEYLLQKKYQLYRYELQRLLDLGYQGYYLLQIMATQLFNLKLIKMAILKKIPAKEAALALNISAFQYGKKSQLLYNINISKINSLLDYFYELDILSKKGKIDLLMSLKTLIERS